jgi:hypothetical protein
VIIKHGGEERRHARRPTVAPSWHPSECLHAVTGVYARAGVRAVLRCQHPFFSCAGFRAVVAPVRVRSAGARGRAASRRHRYTRPLRHGACESDPPFSRISRRALSLRWPVAATEGDRRTLLGARQREQAAAEEGHDSFAPAMLGRTRRANGGPGHVERGPPALQGSSTPCFASCYCRRSLAVAARVLRLLLRLLVRQQRACRPRCCHASAHAAARKARQASAILTNERGSRSAPSEITRSRSLQQHPASQRFARRAQRCRHAAASLGCRSGRPRRPHASSAPPCHAPACCGRLLMLFVQP